MQPAMKIKHVIVDGSNIATEGRDAPSLAQLDEAVQAFVEEYSPTHVTVVVDATFPNRIDRKERQTYEDAVNAGELITPPAGAIGRGDAFVLQIARRAGASILSNDSFQEFHGDYPWLFDKGRLIGGKPVPHVGWVFMERSPVRGATSRRAVRDAKKGRREPAKAGRASKEASQPMPVPKVPPPRKAELVRPPHEPAPVKKVHLPVPSRQEPINDLLPFLGFVEHHPVGSTVEATVDHYSSHGAYATVGDVRAYIPLRFLGDPPPRAAREVLTLGQTGPFIVVSFNAARRGIDLALPGRQPAEVKVVEAGAPAKRGRSKKAVAAPVVEQAPAKKAARRAGKKAAPETVPPAEVESPVAVVPEAEPAKRTRRKAAVAPATADGAPAGSGAEVQTPDAGGSEAAAPRGRKRAAPKQDSATPPAGDGAAPRPARTKKA